jgi:hypothetical protein
MGNTYFPDRSWTAVAYASALCPVHPIHSLSVFRPNGNQPTTGYAVMFWFIFSGWTDTSLPSQIGDAQPQQQAFLDAGYMIIAVMLPPSRGHNTGNQVSDPAFDPGSHQYGDAYVGNGCIEPIGTTHWLDATRFMAPKSAGMAVQFVVTQTLLGNLPCDLTRVAGMGRSAGGIVGSGVQMSQDFSALMFPGGTGQDAVSTRLITVGFWDITPQWFPIYDLDGLPAAVDPTDPLDTGCDFHAYMFAQTASAPLLNAPSDSMGQAAIQTRARCSPLVLAQQTFPSWAADSTHLAANRALHYFWTSAFPGTAGAPYDITNTNVTVGVQAGAEHKAHSIWHPTASHLLLGANSRLVATDPSAANGHQDETITLTNAGVAAALYAEQVAFANAALNYVWPPVTPVHLPVESQVTTAIKAELETVLQSNGYETDIKAVFDGGAVLSSLPEYPAAMVQAIGTEYSDAYQYPKIQGVMRIGLLLAVKTNADLELATTRFIADVIQALQTRFDTDRFGQLFHNMTFLNSERVIDPTGADSFAGATVELQVTFAQLLDDPYTAA